MSSDRQRLVEKLSKPEYRHAYVSEHVRRGIAHQVRAMREQPSRGWNQGELSRRLDKPQSTVSRIEDPGYGKVTVQTLLELAAAFDVALSIRFVDFPTFVSATRALTDASMQVDGFDVSQFKAPQSKASLLNIPAGDPEWAKLTRRLNGEAVESHYLADAQRQKSTMELHSLSGIGGAFRVHSKRELTQ
ncbi:MAG: helix-turn-helix transcriptional regulator [Hyphomicrobiaceae bacterium]|nr:helix-turn-helix transcriptional regulator [Hyphomicrobiaceae bacterium]